MGWSCGEATNVEETVKSVRAPTVFVKIILPHCNCLHAIHTQFRGVSTTCCPSWLIGALSSSLFSLSLLIARGEEEANE